MSRRCPLSGKAVQTGNLVSHSNHKTRCRFKPNLQVVTLQSDALKQRFRMRIATNTIRTIDVNGGFDAFILSTSNLNLPLPMRRLKKRIQLALQNNAAAQ